MLLREVDEKEKERAETLGSRFSTDEQIENRVS